MSNDPDSPGSGDEEIWSEVDEAYPDGSHPGRRDGFTPKRRRVFLKTLRKTGCLRDACRRAGISDTAAYKLRERDPLFARLWDTAAASGGADMELLAWHYAVEGEEEDVWAYGKKVGTRRRRDAALFRILLQGSNPHKYGGSGIGSRKQLEKKIRAEIEAERDSEHDEREVEEARERIARRIDKLRERMLRDEGGHLDAQGRYVPPGYVLAAEAALAEPPPAVPPDATPGEAGCGVSAPGGADTSGWDGDNEEDEDAETTGHPISGWRSCPRPEEG